MAKKDTEASEARRHRGTKQWRLKTVEARWRKKTRRLRRHEGIEERSSGGTKPWRHDGKKDTEASEARMHKETKQ